MFDLDTLLAPISDDTPSGEDLEYDSEFSELEMANRPTEERVIGDTVIPSEEPDYGEVTRQAQALLSRTHDLRVAVIIANAALRTEGIGGFHQALAYIQGCLENHWDTVHPQLDEDDGDATMRVNAVFSLAGRDTVLRSLRLCPLLRSRAFGLFNLRDLEIAAGDISVPGGEAQTDSQTIAAAARDMDPDDLAALLTAVGAALEAVKSISAIFDDHIGADGPDLDPLQTMLFDIRRRVSALAPGDIAEGAGMTDDADAPAAAPVAGAARAAPSGAITSPAEVRATLDRIMTYYRTYEPSSPLPILLERAKRLVGADFVTIIRDLAPEGMGNVRIVGGIEPDEGEEGTYD